MTDTVYMNEADAKFFEDHPAIAHIYDGRQIVSRAMSHLWTTRCRLVPQGDYEHYNSCFHWMKQLWPDLHVDSSIVAPLYKEFAYQEKFETFYDIIYDQYYSG